MAQLHAYNAASIASTLSLLLAPTPQYVTPSVNGLHACD